MNSETKTCQNCHSPFIIEPDDFAFYERIKVPPPTFCAECREKRRIASRNERSLYRRKCDMCGKEVVSRISPDKTYPMYCNNCWWSDKWDVLSYGRDFDATKPFFAQYKELLYLVPHVAMYNSAVVNSDWVNQETNDKNCYLNVGGHYNENSAYNTYEVYGKDSLDCHWLLNSEFCYAAINCHRCYKAFYSQDCFDCQDTYFSYDCRNCTNILGCAGLRNKQNYIFNKPVSKEEFAKFLEENPLSSAKNVARLAAEARKIGSGIPRRFSAVFKSVNCSGNNLVESKNAHYVFDGGTIENSKYLFITGWVKDSYDMTSSGGSELSYECSSGGGGYNVKFTAYSMSPNPLEKMHSRDLEYCYATGDCDSCFGCVGLRSKKYCILNKQYSEADYQKKVAEIRQQMMAVPYADGMGREYRYGEFFPSELSLFGYNESAAMDYYPLTRDEALAQGYVWSDYESETSVAFSGYEIPDDIKDVKDDVLEKVLECEVSGKPYKIIPMELAFYRRMGLPLPRRAPLQRHKDRTAKLLPRKLFDRACECGGKASNKGGFANTTPHFHGDGHCPNIVQTPYAPDRPEIVYCEQCYQTEII
ncbi:MAG: hypothetical protein V1885_03405 [Candidatus Brennerbacteria bacterium]